MCSGTVPVGRRTLTLPNPARLKQFLRYQKAIREMGCLGEVSCLGRHTVSLYGIDLQHLLGREQDDHLLGREQDDFTLGVQAAEHGVSIATNVLIDTGANGCIFEHTTGD